MKDLTPVPPSDSGFQLMEPMANNLAPAASKFRPQKFLFALRTGGGFLCWLWVSGTGTAVIIFFHSVPTFVSYGSMWETEKLELPDGGGVRL